ncbi:MAG TPA: YbfB/YjiJ family MFS transporter [Burkholderiales bacterium]|nr:YbfB/YjiJ family MFS transporter [Burkholderiales bacterium]
MAAMNPDPAKKELGAGVAVAGLLALAVAIGVGRFAFTPVLPMMQEDFGVSVAAGGWLASANYAGYLLGALSAMTLRVQPVPAIRCGLLAIGFTTLAMGLETHFVSWLLLRALAGVASAWVLIHVSAWSLERLAPLRRPLLSGIVFAGVGAGIAFAGVVCMVLMHAAAGAATAWVVLGLLSLVLAAASWSSFRGEGPAPSQAGGRAPQGAQGRRGEAARLVFSYFALGYGYIIPATFLPVMARQAIQDPAVFGWSWPLFGLMAAVSTVVAASLPESGNRRLWIVSQLFMALGVALPLLLPGSPGILLSAIAVGGTFMVITMAGLREARAAEVASPTGLMAAMTAAFALGQIAGPVSVSVTAGAHGSFSGSLVAASLMLAAGACAVAWPRAASPAAGFPTEERRAH